MQRFTGATKLTLVNTDVRGRSFAPAGQTPVADEISGEAQSPIAKDFHVGKAAYGLPIKSVRFCDSSRGIAFFCGVLSMGKRAWGSRASLGQRLHFDACNLRIAVEVAPSLMNASAAFETIRHTHHSSNNVFQQRNRRPVVLK